ncbi:MAG: 2-alkenal reductase [Ignavibacteria bacterium GWA2_55_25]|nr:MAG: 2-alkenal reductase [Ignavibacteria bacterium GWA2_55_25]
MKNGLKWILFLSIPLIIGFGIGYAIKPATGAMPTPTEAGEPFPVSVQVQDRSQQETDQISNSRQNAITRAVARVSPAVVGINVTEVREQQGLIPNDPFFRRFFDQDPFFRQYFGNRKYEVKGLGSGVIISPDGYIITNDHVAGNATEITITLVGGKRLKAELIGTDPLSDVALLKVDGNDLPNATLGNSDEVVIGEWAIALGNPFGLFEINDKPTVTVGVISSTGMNLGRQNNRVYRDMIETDAAINGGNSGGPLVNSLGEVVGINTLIFTGGVSQTFVGYGFAIPVNKVKRIVAELRKRGKVERDIWTGFEAQQVDARVARYFGMAQVQGVIVSDVFRNGPAEKAGIKVGDIILEISGEKINSEEELFAVLNDARPGDTLRLKVYRERKEVQVQLRVEQKSS